MMTAVQAAARLGCFGIFTYSWSAVLFEDAYAQLHDEAYSAVRDGLTLFIVYGSGSDLIARSCSTTSRQCDEFEHVCTAEKGNAEMADICGGGAKASRLAARRCVLHGSHFDLVVNIDLARRQVQQKVYEYFEKTDVLVAVMAAVCMPFGRMRHLAS